MTLLFGSIVAATAASACCIGPVLFTLLGAGALGAAAAQMEVYRPLFLTAAVAMLGGAFYLAYRPAADGRCDAGGTCGPPQRRTVKTALWIAMVLVALLALFPYYVEFLV